MQEQEQLIKAFQDENRAASVRVKALEGQLKEKATSMQEERSALERQIMYASMQQREKKDETATKLR